MPRGAEAGEKSRAVFLRFRRQAVINAIKLFVREIRKVKKTLKFERCKKVLTVLGLYIFTDLHHFSG